MGIDPVRRRMRRSGSEHEGGHAREAAGRRQGQGKPGVPFHRESFLGETTLLEPSTLVGSRAVTSVGRRYRSGSCQFP
ncbi:hypothetical protein C7S14_2525 [Burkholderia cepacia]|nr:hypothetical protein C7S14_2525 [Burkholderia cepacia]